MSKYSENFIIEKAEDLSFNPSECPISANVKDMWIKYSDKNVILNNGQMVYLNFSDEVKDKLMDYFQKMLYDYIQAEKLLNECHLIKKKYTENNDNANNSNKYIKAIFDIILNMDRCYKYVWNIAKLLNNDLVNHKKYIDWQQKKVNIKEDVANAWDLIYLIRNEIEHPEKLTTTFFRKNKGYVECPKIIYNNNDYDLLELGEKALLSVFIISNAVLGASFLYSKFVIYFTDETRTKIYSGDQVV